MLCGRINTPEFAEKILEDDKADLIVMARAQLADANFCNKAKNGQVNQIRYCSNSLYDPSIKHITRIRNPGLLEEATDSLSMTSHPKKVVIASEKEYLLDGVIMVVVLLTMIAFYATSFDSIALTASCYSYHTLRDGEQPNKGIQFMWCILLILLPIALLFAESSMNNLQSVSIVAAFPIGAVIVMIAVSFMKDAKKYMESLEEKKPKN